MRHHKQSDLGILVVVQLLSYVRLCDPMNCSTPGFSVLHHLPEFVQTHVRWVSDAIQPSHPLLPPSPFALYLSQHQGFSNELALHIRWPKYWSFSLASVLPMNTQGWLPLGLTGLISLLSKNSQKSLLQHHRLKASNLWQSAFFMAQLSYPYMTTEKTLALTIWTLLAKWCVWFLMHCLGFS